ncbi:type II toxin-antitoxin system YafQ family toxin [Sphingomonas hankookensis]|uniref:type II toxin-antitoxin system YafQ family toxin n=1 Tax=Sphingomonas hankookensis TaxID=563996 RepID=UPI003D30237D
MSAGNKRARHPRACNYRKSFTKDWERLDRSGRYDMRLLKSVILLLIANDGPLGPEWKDHLLKGEWSDFRECHIGGDFLLIYQVDDAAGKSGTVDFVRAGTHSELFNE